MAQPAEESPEIDDALARAMYAALNEVSPRACVARPIKGEEGVMDGLFDLHSVAAALRRELQRDRIVIGREE